MDKSRNRKSMALAFVCVIIVVVVVMVTTVDSRVLLGRGQRCVDGLKAKTPPYSSQCNTFSKASVTSNSGVCSDIGSDLMKKNGSAVDAAIATLLCLELFEPQSMGIGGGFFMIIYERETDFASVIDAREVAPLAAVVDMFQGNENASQRGSLSIAVPAQIKGMQRAHQKFGRLPWKELFEPTIRLCRDGVQIQASLVKALQKFKPIIDGDPGLRSVFVDPSTGQFYKQNDTVKRFQLGHTLELIANEGPDVFYEGQLAKQLIQEIQQMGGILTMEDFANYQVIEKEAIRIQLSDGVQVFSAPPPSSGIIFSHILLILDGYRKQISKETSVLNYHRIVEAFKYAYARRTSLGDEQFIDMSDLVHNLTSIDYADYTRSLIWDNRTFDSDHYGSDANIEDHGTSHVSVVSPDGDAVSVTSTINIKFGSGILSPSLGIILNDEMDDFSSPNLTNYFGVPPSPNNFIEPKKRPVSSTCSSIFVDPQGNVQLVTGAAGGTMITTSTTLTTFLNLWLGMDLKEATNTPRLHHQLYPPQINYEEGFPQDIIDGLLKIGHNVSMSQELSQVNSIRRLMDGRLDACADGRKDGNVSGF